MDINRDLVVLETNLDDVDGETLSYVIEKLMGGGAMDVWVVPCIMKKGRPGHVLHVLTDDPKKFVKMIFDETGTLGIRETPVKRYEVLRSIEEYKLEFKGSNEKVKIKVSDVSKKAEHDDVKRIAKKYGMPYRHVRGLIEKKFNK